MINEEKLKTEYYDIVRTIRNNCNTFLNKAEKDIDIKELQEYLYDVTRKAINLISMYEDDF